jgi:carbamoyl-phosphate synthase large subunit
VAPQQTAGSVYQQLRDAAFATARAVGVATGGANVQFAVHPETNELRVIEMNPRVSRSSALASKATGFPIAKLAALLAVGYTLDELPNDITQKTTAAFEPALDYVAIKAPRFDFEKFPGAERVLGAEMRAVGEALGLGRTFREAFLKALEGREIPPVTSPADDVELVALAAEPADRWTTSSSARPRPRPAGIHPCFADRLREVVRPRPPWASLQACRRLVRREFEAHTPYYYVTHEGEDGGPEPSGRAVIVLGGGPNRIGQAIEFDYCCVHAAQALRSSGTRRCSSTRTPRPFPRTTTPRIGCTSSRWWRRTSSRLRARAARRRRRLLRGTDPFAFGARAGGGGAAARGPLAAIDLAEDRGRFAKLAGDLAPEWGVAAGVEEARGLAHRLGYPVLVRPHYVIGGRRMHVAHSADELRVEGPCLVDRYLEGGLELDVDALCDGESAWVAAVLEHVEPTGVHSGDSACVLPGPSVTEALEVEIREVANRIAAGLGASGLVNLQLALTGGKLFVLEANPRASRTVPFVAKATGVPLVEHAVRLLLGEPLSALGLPERATPSRAWAKEAVFPAERFPARPLGSRDALHGRGDGRSRDPGRAYARASGRRRSGEAARSPAPARGIISRHGATLSPWWTSISTSSRRRHGRESCWRPSSTRSARRHGSRARR